MKQGKRGIEKLHPKLRMIANGSEIVNGVRAELSSIVVSTVVPEKEIPQKVAADLAKPEMLRAPGNEEAFSRRLPRSKKRGKLTKKTSARHAFVNVFIEVHRDRTAKAKADGLQRVERLSDRLRKRIEREKIDGCVLPRRNMIAATVPVSMLEEIKDDPNVAFVQPAELLTFRLPKPRSLATAGPSAPTSRKVRKTDMHGDGGDVMIGIIDVGGFDFAHPDFLDGNGKTRFTRIWDQGGNVHAAPSRFEYGSEITDTHMNAAIAASKRPGGLPATLLERQSQQEDGSHATHVASIAAGNSGVCSKAQIAAVLIDLPAQASQVKERRTTLQRFLAHRARG